MGSFHAPIHFFFPLSVDPEYKKFLESYSADDEKLTSTPETLLEEIEARNKELIGMEIFMLSYLFLKHQAKYVVYL